MGNIYCTLSVLVLSYFYKKKDLTDNFCLFVCFSGVAQQAFCTIHNTYTIMIAEASHPTSLSCILLSLLSILQPGWFTAKVDFRYLEIQEGSEALISWTQLA